MADSPLPRILVVDDEPPLLKAIRDTLPAHGYAVVAVSEPAEALAQLRHARFDILLTDLNMAGMTGVELLDQALAIDPLLMGIVMTGQGSIDSAVRAMKTGAHDYILKPFKLSAALSVFARALATQKLRRENAALQQRLEARTAELETTNRELEAFSYSVSHDLRAPLRSITGFTEALSEELGSNQPPEILEPLRRIMRASERMDRLINDLLRLARTAREPLHEGVIDMTAVVQEIAAKLQSEDPARKVEWRIEPVPELSADAGLVHVALENLLSNAWKYTRDNPAARVEFSATQPAGGATVYRLTDNGVGFDANKARDLFSPFQRFHPETQFPGSGIGLATVQRIVHRHGGRIWAESSPGQGATFSFSFGLIPASLLPVRANAHPRMPVLPPAGMPGGA